MRNKHLNLLYFGYSKFFECSNIPTYFRQSQSLKCDFKMAVTQLCFFFTADPCKARHGLTFLSFCFFARGTCHPTIDILKFDCQNIKDQEDILYLRPRLDFYIELLLSIFSEFLQSENRETDTKKAEQFCKTSTYYQID